mmetsp:Transcript_4315/g.6582  ORF Transcript_4315/g.6582 Transcript_4315/m.6582 type:complete len:95 (+) Transcript_4315:24-308(+)
MEMESTNESYKWDLDEPIKKTSSENFIKTIKFKVANKKKIKSDKIKEQYRIGDTVYLNLDNKKPYKKGLITDFFKNLDELNFVQIEEFQMYGWS